MEADRAHRRRDEVEPMTSARKVRYLARHGERKEELFVEELDAAAGLYRVRIGDQERVVEWSPSGARDEGSARFDERFQYEFLLLSEGAEKRRVELAKGALTVECVEALVAEARESAEGGPGLEGEEICAPIPGRVVEILVQPGQEVVAGAPVLILEAMKMQNELRASSDGVVVSVECHPGDAVVGGALLIRIGPKTG
jgi:biotin carboxyl carrier protein